MSLKSEDWLSLSSILRPIEGLGGKPDELRRRATRIANVLYGQERSDSEWYDLVREILREIHLISVSMRRARSEELPVLERELSGAYARLAALMLAWAATIEEREGEEIP